MARLPKIQVTLRLHRIRAKDWDDDGEYKLPEGWEPVAGDFDEEGGLTLVLMHVESKESLVVQAKVIGQPPERKLVDGQGTEIKLDTSG